MKWRCPQCGKPHERNDPPCDNCGHHTFERAVVPGAPESDQESFVWVCTECGRSHQRNSPPCSRCGAGTFEKQPLEYEEFDTSTRGYLGLIGRQELAAGALLVGLLAVGILGFVGVISIPGLTPEQAPTVENVPGNATGTEGLSLADVEMAYLEALNDHREAADSARLDRTDTLDAVATYYNQRRVKAVSGDGSRPTGEELAEHFDVQCRAAIYELGPVALEEVSSDSSSALGDALATEALASETEAFESTASQTGIDFHYTPDGRLFVTQVVC